jgi:hypothetical protein
MQKLLTLAGIAFFSLAGFAQAATLQVTLGPSLSYGSGSPLSPNIDLNTYSGLVLNSNAQVLPSASPPGPYVIPSGPMFDNSFLSVYGAEQSTPPGTQGTATFTLTPGNNLFGFTWGTIDHYNTIVLTDSNSHTFTITGADILNHIAGSHDGQTQNDVDFFDPFGTIVTAVLSSAKDSFETANFEQSETPLPPALMLFGTALLVTAFFMRWRQRKAP